MLPDGDGIDFCGEIREKTDAHIIFLTTRTEHEDRIRGLSIGGDDYITKPYKLDEMLIRVKAAMRRRGMKQSPKTTITYGELTLNTLTDRAYLEDKDLLLSQKEFSLLYIFVMYHSEILSKEQLYQMAWGQPMGDNDTALKTALSRLRKKLGDLFEIATLRGKGYIFIHREQ